MKNSVIGVVLLIVSQIACAENESYKCKFENNPNWVSLEIDPSKKELVWGGDEIYDIRQGNKDYVTGYWRESFDGVGGAIMVFDRKNMELNYTAVGLFIVEQDKPKKDIQRENGVAKCRVKK